MKLLENGRKIEYLDIGADQVPCSLSVKLVDRTYRMTFLYNELADFFTVSLEISGSGGNILLVSGEVLRYGKPLFEAFNDERYPLPVLCPLCLTGDGIDTITHDNFGKSVRLYLFDRPSGGEC